LHDWAAATLGNGHLDRVGIHTTIAQDLFAEYAPGWADHARVRSILSVLREWLDWVDRETTGCDRVEPTREIASPKK
jgi:hypothetical protein